VFALSCLCACCLCLETKDWDSFTSQYKYNYNYNKRYDRNRKYTDGDYPRVKQASWFSVLLDGEFTILFEIFKRVKPYVPIVDFGTMPGQVRRCPKRNKKAGNATDHC
jgi:hypothetical protein